MTDDFGDEAHDHLGAMDVEVASDQVPLGEERGEGGGEILAPASVTAPIEDPPGDGLTRALGQCPPPFKAMFMPSMVSLASPKTREVLS